MELRQLAYLVAVVEEGSFTKAASIVHIAQPGVSAQIRQLESELGQQLLERSSSGVRPTEVGAAVLPYARAALAAAAGARHAVDELMGLTRGHVSLGIIPSISGRLIDVPALLADFNRKHPAVEISLWEQISDQLLDALLEGRLDVGLVGAGGRRHAQLATTVVAEEPVVAAVNLEHPLASKSTITLRALQGESLIAPPPGTALRRCLENACAAAGHTPRVALEVSDSRLLAQLAARGLGVAVLTRVNARALSSVLHTLTITRPTLSVQLELVWRADGSSSPAARALVEHARATFGSQVIDR